VAPVERALLASTGYVRNRLHDPRVWLADVRSRAEYEGRESGYDYLEAAGRLPGALHLDDADDDTRLYVRPDGHLRAPREILALWRERGLVPAGGGRRFEREVVFYCGTGWRSSLAFFYAWLLGFGNIRNYSDGWSGWSTEYHEDAGSSGGWSQQPTANPVERGRA
jgi:thiosulfate/3-mercaptopyruvate sulfurtransferase